ncbi:MAG: glycosyltransferase family 2 protein [Solirubrobacteraceae bacterium]
MLVSVVIPSYGRPESLARCLDGIECQRTQPHETLVAVRAGDESSAEVVRERGGTVRLVTVERPGVVAAMNAGIDACSGEVVALTDDDAVPRDDWLQRLVAVYESDPRVGAVGGRDWLHIHGRLYDGSASTVGKISWFGRVTGNHHLGVGPARDVDVLKGVNLSLRGDLLRSVRIDERLRGVGTEHHWELGLCLTVRRLGFRVVYDPSIAVDHRPQPRIEDSRQFSSIELRDATYNETLALLEHLPRARRLTYLAWAAAVGRRSTPGLAQALRSLPSGAAASLSQLYGAQRGLAMGLRAYRRDAPPYVRGQADQVI